MERVQFLEHHGQRVLLLDYSNLDDAAEMLAMVEQRKAVVTAQSPNSVLTLTDVTNARVPRGILSRIKEAAAHERPYVRRAAMVGADNSLIKGVTDAVASFSARQWRFFPTRAEALAWLVSEGEQGAKAS